MLAPAKVEETKRLLSDGKLSQRRIAKLLGVSRATVSAIASGKRPDYEARRRERGDDDEGYVPLGPIERCPGCGGKVHTPCHLCHVRKVKDEEQRAAAYRRRARELAAQRLLDKVREENQQREEPATLPYSPAAEIGPSDSR
jgi:transcriptional regulator with XRE-family HTH domain